MARRTSAVEVVIPASSRNWTSHCGQMPWLMRPGARSGAGPSAAWHHAQTRVPTAGLLEGVDEAFPAAATQSFPTKEPADDGAERLARGVTAARLDPAERHRIQPARLRQV